MPREIEDSNPAIAIRIDSFLLVIRFSISNLREAPPPSALSGRRLVADGSRLHERAGGPASGMNDQWLTYSNQSAIPNFHWLMAQGPDIRGERR
jgi:hypothetical protein